MTRSQPCEMPSGAGRSTRSSFRRCRPASRGGWARMFPAGCVAPSRLASRSSTRRRRRRPAAAEGAPRTWLRRFHDRPTDDDDRRDERGRPSSDRRRDGDRAGCRDRRDAHPLRSRRGHRSAGKSLADRVVRGGRTRAVRRPSRSERSRGGRTGALADQVRTARAAGVKAFGWLPQKAEAAALTEYAAKQSADVVLVSTEDTELIEAFRSVPEAAGDAQGGAEAASPLIRVEAVPPG